MKNNTLLTIFVLLFILLSSPAYSQTTTTKDADYFLGTWSGGISRIATENGKMDMSSIMWRIHKVDATKNQIEMTEISYRASVYDTVSTEKPRMIYTGTIENKCLHIKLTHAQADTSFMLKLSPRTIDGSSYLRSERGLRIKNREVSYMLGKLDSDTTNVLPKDQRKEVTVIVQPPPPVEPKK